MSNILEIQNKLFNQTKEALEEAVKDKEKIYKLEAISGFNIEELIDMFLAGYELKKEN